jgi:hypothetical protein
MSIDVLQQGINDHKNLPLTKVSDGVYRASFPVAVHDGVVNADGLAMVVVNVPGQCRPQSDSEVASRIATLLDPRSLDQQVSVFNNLTTYRERYDEDDLRNSFGNPDYYQIRNFGDGGSSDTIGRADGWFGGGTGGLGGSLQGPGGSGGSGSG